jgi:hypothetical protein
MFRWALLGGSMRTAQHHACRVPSDKITGQWPDPRNLEIVILPHQEKQCARSARTLLSSGTHKPKNQTPESRTCLHSSRSSAHGDSCGLPNSVLAADPHAPTQQAMQHQCRATLRSANCTHQFVWHVQKLQHPQHFLCVRRGCPSVQAHRLPHCCPHSCHRALSACAP